MRILLVNQFFWPDSAATSQLLTDVARSLTDFGHEVHVVCGSSGYSEQDASTPPPVTIRRSPTLPFGRSKPVRLLSYFSFLVTAAVIGAASRKFDTVVTLTTPPLLSVLGTMLKRLRGTRHIIWEMDVYPDVAVDLGMWRADGLVTKMVGAIADYSRGQADGVIALGDCMRERLQQRGLDPGRIHVVENWADGRAIEPLPLRSQSQLRILYSGNFGLAHDIDTIFNAMVQLREDSRFHFIFAGGGATRSDLEYLCERSRITETSFRPYCKRESLGQSLGDGDLGLVTQKDACLGSVVPSKVYGLMAAGRPLLFIGPRESTPAQIIERFRCGWQVDVGDIDGLVDLLRLLHGDPELIRDAGQRARQAFLENYDLPIGTTRVCEVLGAVECEPAIAPSEDFAVHSRTTSSAGSH